MLGLTQLAVLLQDQLTNGARAMTAAIFAEEQRLPMRLAVILARQQPDGIDAALANESRHEIDEENRVDAALFRVQKSLKGIDGQAQHRSNGMGGPRLPRDDSAAAFSDGFDEGVVEEGEEHCVAGPALGAPQIVAKSMRRTVFPRVTWHTANPVTVYSCSPCAMTEPSSDARGTAEKTDEPDPP